MTDGDAPMKSSERANHRRGGIAVDQYAIRFNRFQDRIEGGEGPCAQGVECLIRHHEIEIVIRHNLEQAQHLVQHAAMLASHAYLRIHARRVCKQLHEGSHLDRFRTRAENRKDFHGFTISK